MSEGSRVDTGTILRDLKDDPGAPFVPSGVTAKLRPQAREADQLQKLYELSAVGWLSRGQSQVPNRGVFHRGLV